MAANFVLWCAVESGTYQIAACFPTHPPLFKAIGGMLHIAATTSGKSGGSVSRETPDPTARHSRTLYDSKVAGHFHSLKGDVTVDNEDQVGLVTLGSQRSDIPAGSIVDELANGGPPGCGVSWGEAGKGDVKP
ncbi:hypothetical protein AnigIFM56816_008508 [Aspergillus niger]|nr:hypothetical protein AnigIFM56816_008508 [Aspergillus niger]